MTRNQLLILVVSVIVALGLGAFIGTQLPKPQEEVATAVNPEEDTVLARVGTVLITERELAFAETDLGEQFGQIPAGERRPAILNALIDIKALAAAARVDGMEQGQSYLARIAFLKSRALHNSYFQENALNAIEDSEVRSRFEKEIAAIPPSEEISARHILVKTEEEAKAIIAELDGGADFVALAKEKSTGPSGPSGGDLGFFGKGQMVPEFEAAAFALENGKYTGTPVKTQFGWHVIKKEDQRATQLPEFDAVSDQVRQMLVREKYLELVKSVREGLDIEILDADLKKQMETLDSAN